MQKFSKVYTNSEIVPTGGGSGKGLEDAVEGNTDFGDMSSNKKSSILKNKIYTEG
jgi:ABC-type phosphate transport system substrate-binding protein